MQQINPKEFGLNSKTVLRQTAENHITICVDRKSRIIMSDAKKILEKAQKIKQFIPQSIISLQCSGHICSKSVAFLQENGISILT